MQILITTICSLVAAITGAYIIHKLTRSREHETWVRDCRIAEWRELLEALTKAYITLLITPHGQRNIVLASEEAAKKEALAEVDIALSTRIFIADDVSKLELRLKWATCLAAFHASHNKPAFKASFLVLRLAIVDAAQRSK